MADEDAVAGSISDSTILVIVISLLTGKKFFTPDTRESRLTPRPPPMRSVNLLEMEENPRKRLFSKAGGVG